MTDKANTCARIENHRPIRPDLILCEGKDDQRFLCWLLKKEELNGKWPYFQVLTTDGKDNLANKLKTLVGQEGFDSVENKVRSIAVIFDADNNVDQAASNIALAFKVAGFSVPTAPGRRFQDASVKYPDVATGFMLFPQLDSSPCKGTLESLCLDILSIDSGPCIRCCVDAAMIAVGMNYPRPGKNKLHATLSLTDKYVGQTIGQAANAGAFNPDSERLNALKIFLLQMAGKSYER